MTLKDGTVFAADDLVPQLTVVYKQKGNTTGISSEQRTTGIPSTGIYTLYGVRVDQPMAKGVYIVNGKKVVIR